MTPRELHTALCALWDVETVEGERALLVAEVVREVVMEGREGEGCETTTGKGAR